jgi:hypothetical protein
MIEMPPKTSELSAIEKAVRERHAKILHEMASVVEKSKALIRHILFLQEIYKVNSAYMPNTNEALDIDCKSGYVLIEKGVKYVPVTIVFYRFIEAIGKDKLLIQKAWVDIRDEADRELLAFEAAAFV